MANDEDLSSKRPAMDPIRIPHRSSKTEHSDDSSAGLSSATPGSLGSSPWSASDGYAFDYAAAPLPSYEYSDRVFRSLEKELRVYKDKGKGILTRLKKVSDKQRNRIRKRRQKIQEKMRDPNFVKTKDKMAFTGGVINVILTAVIASRFPAFLPLWFLVWSAVLMGIRFYLYHSQHFHYFMLDFCYLANLLFIFYLFCYPTSPHLFILNMTNANGPLLWAVVMWRNSLVFHDLDKITSTFIHCLPVIVSFVVRWVPESGKHAVCLNPECTISFKDVIVPHMTLFIFWEVCYYLKTEVIDKDRLDADETLVTSFRYLKKAAEQQEKKSMGYKFITMLGPKYQVFLFMIVQGTYHLTTILMVKFMYDSMYFHILMIAIVFGLCIWNGSTFYIVKFTVAYQKRIQQMEETFRKEHNLDKSVKSSDTPPTPDSQDESESPATGEFEDTESEGAEGSIQENSISEAN